MGMKMQKKGNKNIQIDYKSAKIAEHLFKIGYCRKTHELVQKALKHSFQGSW